MANLASSAPWLLPGLLALLLLRWIIELVLDRLNERAALAHAGEVPAPFRDLVDAATYEKSVRYTLARSQFGQLESTYTSGLLVVVLLTGLLPATFHRAIDLLGHSSASIALIVVALPLLLSFTRLPFDWAAQFRIEERFGFNTTTPRTWWLDHCKGICLSLLLGYPLVWLVTSLPAVAGPAWWVYAWLTFLGFQLLLMFVAPVVILPWFNRFTPLPQGSLRERLERLARQTRFHHHDILVMDGSRRSRHSNAFFTGIGRYRRIVLYDTLVSQFSNDELEAILAHEIGHYRLGHVPRMLAASALTSFALFFLFGKLADQPWFLAAFGFSATGIGPLLLLTLVFGGALSFWLSPLANWRSRRFEHQADRFAAQAVGSSQPLVKALRKLTERNLANLTPHPAYSWFHYSHPTLWEREQALRTSLPAPVNAGEISDTRAGK
ncbi:MAG: M48 family metallopeptidase [Verrucomicrobia bacterium]|nr:M48 family metallopeptidase [Verrucomicrobiota bacterium]